MQPFRGILCVGVGVYLLETLVVVLVSRQYKITAVAIKCFIDRKHRVSFPVVRRAIVIIRPGGKIMVHGRGLATISLSKKAFWSLTFRPQCFRVQTIGPPFGTDIKRIITLTGGSGNRFSVDAGVVGRKSTYKILSPLRCCIRGFQALGISLTFRSLCAPCLRVKYC